jgi:hypothetical protein
VPPLILTSINSPFVDCNIYYIQILPESQPFRFEINVGFSMV